MANSKDIQTRIKSLKNTGKITRAMEMVSATKMRKSINSVLAIRPYARASLNVLTNLIEGMDEKQHGLLEIREVKSILVILITSNRGLCGSFNSQIIKRITEEILNPEKLKINRTVLRNINSNVKNEDLRINFVTVGKKGEILVKKLGKDIIASFPELAYFPTIADTKPLSKIVYEEYLEEKYDKVVIAYTDFISVMSQKPKVRQLLPISKMDLKKQLAEMDELTEEEEETKEIKILHMTEPSPEELLEQIVPRLVEMQIYHAILESNASKESARMVAMKNATESAKEMVSDLTLDYNRMRQMKITQEIAEISAGRAALE